MTATEIQARWPGTNMSRSAIVAPGNIRNHLRDHNIRPRLPRLEEEDFNCWGFVAFFFRWIPTAYLLDDTTMEGFLSRKTRAVKQPKTGDVAVFRDEGDLSHTALVLDGKSRTICHKRGTNALCIENIRAAAGYGKVSYRRPLAARIKLR